MSAAPDVVHPQKHSELSDCWNGGLSVKTRCMNLTLPQRLIVVNGSSSGDLKVRKPYTITKQRERWTQEEHQKFLEALKLYGRAWQKIEEHIGTKTAVQIRSHAQKVFSKLERGVSTGNIAGQAEDIDIPPPRPKRKPSHPYPRKAGYSATADEVDKHPTSSSSSEIVANTECAVFSPSIGNRDSELAASTTVHPQSQFKATNSFGLNGGVKLFGKAVIVPKAQKLVAPIKNLARQNISNSSYTQTSKVNLGRTEGFSPFVRVQKNLRPVSIESSVLQTNQNLGTTTVEEDTDDSAEEACTKDTSAGINEAKGIDSQSINHNSKVENCKVDTVGNIEDSIKDSGFLKTNPYNNPDYLWMENLFSHYSGAQYKTQEYIDGPPANPMLFWHFLQASAMNNPFHSAAMASWAGLIGSTQASANEIHSLPPYSGVGSFAPWWNPTGFKTPGQQHSSTVPSCERMAVHAEEAVSIPNMKITEYTKYVKEHGPKPVSISGMAEVENVLDRKERNSNVMPEMEIHQVNGLVEQTSDESDDIEKEASDQAQQSFCTSIDEFEVGDGKMDGSSSGSNNPSEGCQLSEAGTPNNLETNKIDKEKNQHPEKLDPRTETCPEIMFKHIEKRKRYQQRDLKHGSTEDPKRPKGCPHDVDSWKEVSKEGRKAFRALFTNKTLPQTFPRNASFTMNNDQIDGHISIQNPESEYDDMVRLESLKKTVKEEDNSRNSVKFSVSSRSGFVPYQRAICNKPKVTCSE